MTVHGRRQLPSTGIHWRPGVVVTADHTVRMDSDITVSTPDGQKLAAELAGRDPGTDLAVLRVSDLPLPTAPLGDDAAVKVGHMVLALGFGPRASWGVISALGPRWRSWRGGEIDRLVRLDLVLYPGFSGGPLVDASGRVIGVNTSGLSRESRLAVPIATVARVAGELLDKGHVSRGYLGLGMQPVALPDAARAALGVDADTGLIVVTVAPGGPAARAGVMLGDVLRGAGRRRRRRSRRRALAARLRPDRPDRPRAHLEGRSGDGARDHRGRAASPSRVTSQVAVEPDASPLHAAAAALAGRLARITVEVRVRAGGRRRRLRRLRRGVAPGWPRPDQRARGPRGCLVVLPTAGRSTPDSSRATSSAISRRWWWTPRGLVAADIGDSGAIRVGELVFALGNPLGHIRAVSAGLVHTIGPRVIQADLRLAPGNSGGPLADARGRVIGLNTMIAGGLAVAVRAGRSGASWRSSSRR